MVEVIGTEVFETWYLDLDKADSEAVDRVVGLLEVKGTSLGMPYSSGIQGSQYPLRELRVQSRGHPLRVFYVFDPRRQAVLLLGGDKTGQSRFYETFVPKAEALFEEYLKGLEEKRT